MSATCSSSSVLTSARDVVLGVATLSGRGAGVLLLLFLPLLVALFAPGAAFAGLTLDPVGAPIPGNGPVGLAIVETGDATYAIIGEHLGNQVSSYAIDPSTGLLTLVGSVSLPNGPSAVAATGNGQFALATTLRGNDVTSYHIDRSTGTLSVVGAVPTGGTGPVNLDISNDGFAVIANKDSDSLGVVEIDRSTGELSPIGAVPICDAPNDLKITRRHVGNYSRDCRLSSRGSPQRPRDLIFSTSR